jgi:hypothetical protein
VTVLPGIVDRMGNARPAAYDLVFSTGAPITPNVVGGVATDRITGRPAEKARVEAVSRQDSTVHTTVTDSVGFFAMRSLPAGTYHARIYTDQNQNRTLDPAEARATVEFTMGANDTIPLEVSLLAPDTTAARLVRAEPRDSLQVRLVFDDYMDPPAGDVPLTVVSWLLPDSTMISGGRVLTERAFRALQPADTTGIRPPGLVMPSDTARAVPVNELIWIPPTPLRPTTRYRVAVSGYRNLHGLTNGGGSVVFTTPARREPPPRAVIDSAADVPRDTTDRR